MHRLTGSIIAAVIISIFFMGSMRSLAMRQFTGNDNGTSVELRMGEIIEVVLSGNPTTGFIWTVAPSSTRILRQVGQPKFKPDFRLIGAGGKNTFCFKVVLRGQGKLNLIYHRPWEKIAPQKTFWVKILVK